MSDIDSIFQKFDTNVPVSEIRQEIAALIADHMNQMRQSLGYWEKSHFLSAIAALAWNRPSQEPHSAWLRLCLVNIESALVPKDQRDENYGRKDPKIEALTYEQLVGALNDTIRSD